MSLASYFLIIISVLFNALAQISLKLGANRLAGVNILDLSTPEKIHLFMSMPLLIGMGFYTFSIATWVVALSRVDVSTAYPMLSLGYIVVCILAWYFLGENISQTKVIAMILIVSGVVLMSKS
ncbi:EamA family transporter [Polynucleobacter paneuropaeus]|nr:EamA family transporter [Polynucleobacter paneuropaeus]